jgi:hypothetical protein
MSPRRQEELSGLLACVFALEPVQELAPDRRFLRVHHGWLTAGEITQRTVARLSAALRRAISTTRPGWRTGASWRSCARSRRGHWKSATGRRRARSRSWTRWRPTSALLCVGRDVVGASQLYLGVDLGLQGRAEQRRSIVRPRPCGQGAPRRPDPAVRRLLQRRAQVSLRRGGSGKSPRPESRRRTHAYGARFSYTSGRP